MRSDNRPAKRLDEQHAGQRDGHDPRRRGAVEAAGVGEEFLEVDGVGVESRGAAGGQRDDQEGLARVIAEQVVAVDLTPVRLGRDIFEAQRLVEPAAEDESDHREHRAGGEADAPAPVHHRLLAKRQPGARPAAPSAISCPPMIVTYWKLDQKPRRSRSAISRQIGRARPIFAAQAEALDHPRDEQDRGRQQPGLGVGRGDRDHQRAQAHQGDRQGQPGLAALAVGINPHHPGADRPDDEADREDRRGLEQLRGLVALGEEGGREIEREGRIDVPVEPFDEVAGRAADDVLQSAAVERRALCTIGVYLPARMRAALLAENRK